MVQSVPYYAQDIYYDNFQLLWWEPRAYSNPAICNRSISGGFNRLVTYDLAESPILFRGEFLCTTAMELEYNPYASK